MDLHIICTAAVLEGQIPWVTEGAQKAQNQGGQAEQDLKGRTPTTFRRITPPVMRLCSDEVEALAKLFQLWLRHKNVLEKNQDEIDMLSSSFLKRKKERTLTGIFLHEKLTLLTGRLSASPNPTALYWKFENPRLIVVQSYNFGMHL